MSSLEGIRGKSPAQNCGIKGGDLILTFNDRKISSTEHLQELLRQNGFYAKLYYSQFSNENNEP